MSGDQYANRSSRKASRMIRNSFQIAAIVVACSFPSMVRADDEGVQLQALLEKQSPAICTVKAVLKTEFKAGGQSQDQESKLTMQGVVVDPEGIVMMSNMPFSPGRAMEMFGRGGEGEGFNVKATPSSIKVIFAKEDKEYDAFLAATDTKLDLVFIKVEGLGDRKLPFVDFGTTSELAIGQPVVAISRLKKGYDYAAYVQTARVIGEIAKPRKAWMLQGGVSELGLPVFAMNGNVIGVLTTVPAAGKEEGNDDSMNFAMFMRFFSGGGGNAGGAFVVPGQSIKLVVEQAKQRAVTLAVERAKKKDTIPPPAGVVKKPATTAPPKPKPNKP
jgi:S1-C subfamily serine protease